MSGLKNFFEIFIFDYKIQPVQLLNRLKIKNKKLLESGNRNKEFFANKIL